ncbi:MAG TPA: branched-chain amino acid ABC transporter permease [Firmicutes bacterium]|nr:branched-chain amino acid ABC transporter permease [Bacillota bacterium]
MLLQQLLNGITQGSIYALMAIGFSVVLGIVGLVTFVHGEVIMIGAFAGFYAITLFHANVVVALLAGFAASWVLGSIIERVAYRPFRRSPEHIALICTIGASIILKNLGQAVFGTETQLVPDLFGDRFFMLGGLRVTFLQAAVLATVVAMCVLLQQLLYRTRLGISLRAVSMDKDAAALLGVNINRAISIGNSVGCALGGVAGVLLGMYYNSVNPVMGAEAGMKAFAAAVLGGLTSIPGAALGGLLLGIFENMGVALFSSGYRDIIAFLILISVLLVRPSGILGRREERV